MVLKLKKSVATVATRGVYNEAQGDINRVASFGFRAPQNSKSAANMI